MLVEKENSKYKGMYEETKEYLHFYGKKLGIDKETINDLFIPSINQLDEILQKEVEPYVDEWDRKEVKLDANGMTIFPESYMNAYKKIVSDKKGFRYYESIIPEEYGGVGFPGIALASFVELVSMYDTSLNVTIGLATTIIEAIQLYPSEYLTSKYFPKLLDGVPGYVAFTEAQAGSNLKNIQTTSRQDGDFFIAKGTKIFISNGGFGEIGILLTKDVDGKGTNAFIVDNEMKDADDSSKPGIRTIRLEEKLGIHGSPTGVMEFNVVIPKENLLGPQGKGYKTVLERLLGMRMGVSLQALGIAEKAYQLAKDYSRERVQFGKPIGSFPAISNKLRGMEINLSKMRKLSYESAYILSKFQANPKTTLKTKYLKLTPEEEKTLSEFSTQYNRGVLNHTVSKAKMFNSEVGYMITDDALQIFGGYGFIRDYKIEKLLRDFRILRIYEGTSEIQEYILNASKAVVRARSLDKLMEISMQQKGIQTPAEAPLDYSELFYRRFPSVMDAFMDRDGQDRYLFDD
jgi:butyryl-CoA dehydrogenase